MYRSISLSPGRRSLGAWNPLQCCGLPRLSASASAIGSRSAFFGRPASIQPVRRLEFMLSSPTDDGLIGINRWPGTISLLPSGAIELKCSQVRAGVMDGNQGAGNLGKKADG